MPDREYNLIYKSDNTDILSKTAQVIAALTALDAMAVKTNSSLSGFAGGGGRSAAAASRQIQKLDAAMVALQAQAATTRSSLASIGSGLGAVSGKAGSATSALGRFGAAGLALGAVHKVLGDVLKATEELEQYWKSLSKEAIGFRDSLRELKDITGHKGPTDKVVEKNVLDISNEAHMMPAAARELYQSAENILPAAREKGNIVPEAGETVEELQHKIIVQAAKLGREKGIDEAAVGEAVGTAALFGKVHNVQEAMEPLGTAFEGLSRGNLRYSTAVPALNEAAAAMVTPEKAAADAENDDDEGNRARAGRLGSYGEAGVYMGVVSLGTGQRNPQKAKERMIQVSRLLNTSSDKGRAALKGAGITDEMTDTDKLIQLRKYTDERSAKDKKFDTQDWLKQNKLGSDRTREATIAVLKNADVLDTRLRELGVESYQDRKTPEKRAAALKIRTETARRTVENSNKFAESDPTALAAGAESANKVWELQTGEEMSAYETAKRYADVRMKFKNPAHMGVDQWAHQNFFQPFNLMAYGEGSKEMHLVAGFESSASEGKEWHGTGARPTLIREGKKVGVDVERQFPEVYSHDLPTRAKAFGEAARAVQGAGGDPYAAKEVQAFQRQRIPGFGTASEPPGQRQLNDPGVARDVNQLVKETQETNRLLRDGLQRPGGAGGSIPQGGGPVPVAPVNIPGQGPVRE